jgi:hypothetical protein
MDCTNEVNKEQTKPIGKIKQLMDSATNHDTYYVLEVKTVDNILGEAAKEFPRETNPKYTLSEGYNPQLYIDRGKWFKKWFGSP